MEKEELYKQFDLVQEQLDQISSFKDVVTVEENEQLVHDCKHINHMLNLYEDKSNDKLVYMLRYFKHKFSVILKALSSRYTDSPIYFSPVQLMNSEQYIKLVT